MNERLEEIMNWAEVEDVTYAETANPKKILGAHIIPEGLLVQSFVPTAKSIELVLGGQRYPMELVDEAGFFATLLPVEEAWNEALPAYTYHITYDNDTTEDTEDPYAFPSTYTDRDIRSIRAASGMTSMRRWARIRSGSTASMVSRSPYGLRTQSVFLSSATSTSGMAAAI